MGLVHDEGSEMLNISWGFSLKEVFFPCWMGCGKYVFHARWFVVRMWSMLDKLWVRMCSMLKGLW